MTADPLLVITFISMVIYFGPKYFSKEVQERLHSSPISPEAIQSRLVEGRKPRYGPLLMLVARPALILLAQGITFLLLRQLNVPNAAVAVRNWWSVYGTLVDLGCLELIY
jgi:hypothetical protein